MKVLLINGSPGGANSNCAIMLEAFIKGAPQECEIVLIHLSDYHIENCKGCTSCWTNKEGCVIKDDLDCIMGMAEHTDLIVFATPVYFGNLTGLLKNFIDRLTSTGNPHKKVQLGAPKFVIMSNCGFPSKSEFNIISLWMTQFVSRMNSKLLREFYFESGKRLQDKGNKEAKAFLKEISKFASKLINETNLDMGSLQS